MKILVLGDIHGRLIWYDIIKKENPDITIFLGDYVDTHEYISPEQQLINLEDILNFKEDNPDKVILLRGNHDLSELGWYWAECSGFNKYVCKGMMQIRDRFLKDTKWIHIEDNIIFSHAGVSQAWLDYNNITLEEINSIEPCPMFAFTSTTYNDIYGTSPEQPCVWIRPQTLAEYYIKNYDQIVGHTPVNKIINVKNQIPIEQNIWLCDTLGVKQYLIIENGDVKICQL